MAPSRKRRDFWSWIPEDPVRAGLMGIAAASGTAFLSRWPVLLALPGVAVGAAGGVFLIMRGRAIHGVIVSLVAILLPLALLPGPRDRAVPTSEPESVVAAPNPGPVPVKVPTPQPAAGGPVALPERTLPSPENTIPGTAGKQ